MGIQIEKQKFLLNVIREENEKMRGTTNYSKYHMISESKINGRWIFTGWTVPCEESAIVKQVKNNIYLMPNSTNRYTITEEIKKLLNI